MSDRPHPPLDRWSPLRPHEMRAVLADFRRPWWIAGGWAIELHAGRAVRHHDDVDVLVLRDDHMDMHGALEGWELWAADPPGTLRPWPPGEQLPASVHDVWCTRRRSGIWQWQIMIDECVGVEWVSRRDDRVRKPVDQIGCRTVDGLTYLAPEVQLYYKAFSRRPKDERDFAVALPTLSLRRRTWLGEVLRITDPDHPWRGRLRP